jgi:GTP-binding protein
MSWRARKAAKVGPVSRSYTRDAPFVDRVKCLLSSGGGGNGAAMFSHYPNHEYAGPSGANGGKGGSVFVTCSRKHPDLAHLKALGPNVAAARGVNGSKENREGVHGKDLTLQLPPGTVVTDVDTNNVVLDVDIVGTQLLLLEGGRGGRGNSSFRNAVNHSPIEATKGLPGDTMLAQFELKMIADVGLVGFPNAGKSSLLGAISTAKPKVAAYPFATLHPTIGTLHDLVGNTCDVADLPGLIEGAYENRGLGHQFLRHVERNEAIAYVVDMVEAYVPPDRSEPQEPWEVVETLAQELDYFLPGLSERGLIVFANKMDVTHDWRGNRTADKFSELARRLPNLSCFPVSARVGAELGSREPAAGLTPAIEFMCKFVFDRKAAKRAAAEAQRESDLQELDRMFRDTNPQLYRRPRESISKEYNVHYVKTAALEDDMRYVEKKRTLSRTEEMLAKRKERVRTAAKGKSVWDDLSDMEAILPTGGSLVDQQLESTEGNSGYGTPLDTYLDLDNTGRAPAMRDTTMGVLEQLALSRRKAGKAP